jgi:hypothetical protein
LLLIDLCHISEESLRNAVADTYVFIFLKEKETRGLLSPCVAEAESQDFDFDLQKNMAVAVIKRCWGRLDGARKAEARNIDLGSVDLTSLSLSN